MVIWRSLIPVLCILVCNFYLLQGKVVISTNDCGVTKGCFRPTNNCTQLTCPYLVTYRQNDTSVYFEVSGIVPSGGTPYVTLGINEVAKMYDAYTIGCFWDGSGAKVQDGRTLPSPDRGHKFSEPPNNGVAQIDADYDTANNVLSCTFARARDPGTNKDAKDLRGNYSYYLMAAIGQNTDLTKGLGYHSVGRWLTLNELNFGNFTNSSEPANSNSISKLLFQIHGSLMLVAWVTLATVGVMLGMHFRVTISNTDLLGSRTWLKLHRVLQITAVVMTVASFIIIFVAVGELRIGEGISAAHPIIGIIVMSIALVNGLGVFTRRLISAENNDLRQYVNQGHMLMGRLVLILALVNVLLGLLHETMALPKWPAYVVFAVIVFSILVEIALYLHGHYVTKHNEELSDKVSRDKRANSNDKVQLIGQAEYISMKGHPFRISALVLYVLVGVATAIVVILAIADVLPATTSSSV